MSGSPNYQSKQYQKLANKGPIPEGTYNVNQDQLQHMSWINSLLGRMSHNRKHFGTWPGGQQSWGRHRIWLKPEKNTNTFGRTNISIHGGANFGSRGCLDLAEGMDDFTKNYQDYGVDMKLKTKYPSDW